jgi:DNA-binding IclR family transcriptional regulator
MVRPVRANREPGGTQSVDRALSLLDAFTPEHPERRVIELVEVTGLGQSTVSRLVGALESFGLLVQDRRSGLYRLGPRVVGLGALALNQLPIFRYARQPAQDLAADLGLGANVAERHGPNLFYLCHFEGPLAPRTFTMVGRGGPLHATGLGKALLSDMSDAEVEALLGRTFPANTPKTITRLGELLQRLAEVRERGYATEIDEQAFGRACVAAPIRNRAGEVIAALSVSGPSSALALPAREAELAGRVIEQADKISSAFGYDGGVPLVG